MKTSEQITIDGNEAAAYVAYKTNEVIAIYPITPSSIKRLFSTVYSRFQRPAFCALSYLSGAEFYPRERDKATKISHPAS
jgi:hypothetical protein